MSISTSWPEDPCAPFARPLGPPYLGADAEVVVGDELWALSVASVEPAVEGAQGHTRERQHEGQEAPGARWVGGKARVREKVKATGPGGPWKVWGHLAYVGGCPEARVCVCVLGGQGLAPLTSCPSVVSLGCAGQAPTQGPQRQSHCGKRSWEWEWHCPSTLLH